MKTLSLTLVFLVLIFAKVNAEDGPAIFKKNCTVCHTVGGGKLVGPDLKGADKKHDIKWLIQWVKSSQTMVKTKKDPDAIKLFSDNNNMVMPDQALSDDEIKTVAAFIGEETAKLDQPVAPSAPDAAPTAVASAAMPAGTFAATMVSSQTINYILTGVIVFLTMVLIALARIIKDLAAAQKSQPE